MKKLLCVATIALITFFYLQASQIPSNQRTAYEQWKIKYGKNTLHSHDDYRYRVFLSNLALIHDHNSYEKQTYLLGENQFMDMTPEEFQAKVLQVVKIEPTIKKESKKYTPNDSVDWSSYGHVRNQGQCASWAMLSTDAVDALFAIRGSTTVELSQQQLLDCDAQSQGCISGSVQSGLQYIKENGLTTEQEYPYVGKKEACKQKGGPYRIGRYATFSGEEDFYAIFFAPLIATFDATKWQFYKGGVLTDCPATSLNHQALVVGLDEQGIWKVRNTWGTAWGESGYIRLGSGNTCGIFTQGYQPSLFW